MWQNSEWDTTLAANPYFVMECPLPDVTTVTDTTTLYTTYNYTDTTLPGSTITLPVVTDTVTSTKTDTQTVSVTNTATTSTTVTTITTLTQKATATAYQTITSTKLLPTTTTMTKVFSKCTATATCASHLYSSDGKCKKAYY